MWEIDVVIQKPVTSVMGGSQGKVIKMSTRTTIKRTLTPFIAPKGKKFNQPCSLGVPTVKHSPYCPVCSTKEKLTVKESESAPMCKACHEKKKVAV